MTSPAKPPDIEARISYLPTAAGGKSCAVTSGYRPNHDFGLGGILNDAHHEYLDVESVAPGATARAALWLLVPDYHVGRFFPGFRFTVQEGSRIVGHGVVTDVVNPVLRATGG